MNRILSLALLTFAMLVPLVSQSLAKDRPLPDMAIYQAMLDANRDSGWVQFRDYDGQQLIYFTALQTMHCRLSEIRYSINSDALDQKFPLVDCISALPFSLPSDSGLEEVAISLPSGEAKTVTVQIVWEDGAESDILTFEPCEGVGDSTCALPVEE